MSDPNKDGTDIVMALLMGLSGPRASKAWTESQQIKAESFLTMAEHWINQTAEENARLKADVDALNEALFKHSTENHRLQLQVERLTKAGDFMANRLMYQGYHLTIPQWNEAKDLHPRA